ncbi:LOG family protein [Kingella kingae]|uniref:LOG family protein n=1 Tax=Kingella kingae TaxID=504 RepID=UPI003D6F190B
MNTATICNEFTDSNELLSQLPPAVTIFGSARIAPSHPEYLRTERLARLLSDSGFSVFSGGGPGIMEAANKGAFAGKSPTVGMNLFCHTNKKPIHIKTLRSRLKISHRAKPCWSITRLHLW